MYTPLQRTLKTSKLRTIFLYPVLCQTNIIETIRSYPSPYLWRGIFSSNDGDQLANVISPYVHNSSDNKRNVCSEVHKPFVAFCPPKIQSNQVGATDKRTCNSGYTNQLNSKTGRVKLNPECERNLVLLNLRNTAHLPTKISNPWLSVYYHLVQFIRLKYVYTNLFHEYLVTFETIVNKRRIS